MSPKLTEILQQAVTLPTDEQLQLIAHLVETLRQQTPNHSERSVEVPPEAKNPSKTGKSIWQLAEDFIQDLPAAELAKLPVDGAEQHDHYIYGTPKVDA
jgi:hypothetical protein